MSEIEIIIQVVTAALMAGIPVGAYFLYRYIKKKKSDEKRNQEEADRLYKERLEIKEKLEIQWMREQKEKRDRLKNDQSGQQFLQDNEIVFDEIIDDTEDNKTNTSVEVWTAPERSDTQNAKPKRLFENMTTTQKMMLVAVGVLGAFIIANYIMRRKK